MSKRSHVEVGKRTARHYDLSMDLLLLGRYQAFIEQAIERMDIRQGDAILDLGSGTGRNIRVMLEALGSTGQVVGVDISQEMLRQARRRCQAYPQVTFLNRRIEQPLPFHEEFDKAFIAFTLHGFEDGDKERVIANAHQALKPGGIFWILDYDEFDLDRQWLPFRWAFRRFECELASEFLSLDLKDMLAHQGFGDFVTHLFLGDYVRLLGAERLEVGDEGCAASGLRSWRGR
jgi:ubiquinone/menaquinone biosynthesis C-methylase UbiE